MSDYLKNAVTGPERERATQDEIKRLQTRLQEIREHSQTRRCLICGKWANNPRPDGPSEPSWHTCLEHRGLTNALTPWDYIIEIKKKFERELSQQSAREKDLVEAARRSLNWLSSYRGSGADNAYDQMRKALAPYEEKKT